MSEKYTVLPWFKNKIGGVSIVDKSDPENIIDCSDYKKAEEICKILNDNADLINGNYHSVYSEPKEHCMGHQLIYRKGDESQTILAETFSDVVANIIVKAMNETEQKQNG